MPKISVESFLYSNDFGDDDFWASSSSDDDGHCKCNSQSYNNIQHNNKLYSDVQFQNIYRISKSTFHKLLGSLKNDKNYLKDCCENANSEQILSILLLFLGSNSTFKEMSLKINVPIYCVHSIVSSALDYFCSNKKLYVTMPKDDELCALSQLFNNKSKLEKIIAVLGVSHVHIHNLQGELENDLSVKGYYAVRIQGLIAADYRFLDCCISSSSSDGSGLLETAEYVKENAGSYKGYYFAASESSNVPMVVNPLPKTKTLTKDQRNFNRNHCTASRIAKQCFGCLKGRFTRLQETLNYDLTFTSKIILTCCILHNLCLKFKDECDFYEDDVGFQSSS